MLKYSIIYTRFDESNVAIAKQVTEFCLHLILLANWTKQERDSHNILKCSFEKLFMFIAKHFPTETIVP